MEYSRGQIYMWSVGYYVTRGVWGHSPPGKIEFLGVNGFDLCYFVHTMHSKATFLTSPKKKMAS